MDAQMVQAIASLHARMDDIDIALRKLDTILGNQARIVSNQRTIADAVQQRNRPQ